MSKIITSLRNLSFVLIMISAMISCSKEKIDLKIPVVGIKLSSELEVIEINSDIVLKANVLPATATNKNITWSSQDAKIATVDKNGKVHAVKAGEVIITVKAEGSKINATCKITVKTAYIPIQEIVFKEAVKSIVKGSTFTPEVKITPQEATDRTLVWSSSNDEIASVDDKGLVTAKKVGEIVITAKSVKDKKTATYTIKIEDVYLPIQKIEFTEAIVTVVKGYTFAPVVKITPLDATNKTLVWSSSNAEIASVDDKGLVTAKKIGEVTITGTSTKDKKTATYIIKIEDVYFPIQKIEFTEAIVTVVKGSTFTPVVKITPLDATNKTLVWSSSNAEIASVDDKGLVTAKQVGEVTITGASTKDKKTATYTLKIKDAYVAIQKIEFTDAIVSIVNGSTFTPVVKITPLNVTNKTLVWSSSNAEIASVDDKGLVTAKQVGEVTITGTSTKDKKTGTYTLKIVAVHIPMQEIAFAEAVVSIVKGSTFTPVTKIIPQEATDKTLVWSSNNADIASVDNKGLVTAKQVGEVIITGKSIKDKKSATYTLKVEEIYVAIQKIAFTESIVSIVKGATFTPEVKITPQDATDKTLVWSSSNELIASVNDKGLVTSKQVGEVTITATSTKDKKTSTYTLKILAVHIPIQEIAFTEEIVSIVKGATFTPEVKITPQEATDKNLVWSSSDDVIASVDSKGLVTAKQVGEVRITGKSLKDNKVATYILRIRDAYVSIQEIVFAKSLVTIVKGSTFTPEVTITPQKATNKTLVWSSSSIEIASVDSKGLVTAKKVGEVTITGTSTKDKKTAIYTLRIVDVHVPIKDIVFREPIVNLSVGDRFMPEYVITPSKATNKTLVWSSSNADIASVDDKGVVTAIKEGEVTITGTSTRDKKTATYTIKIEKRFIQIYSIGFKEREVLIVKGTKYTPGLYVNPENATEKIVWTSSDSDIASVDDKGIVTAIEVGEVTITALGEKNKKGGNYLLKVVKTHIPITEIRFAEYNDNTLAIGYKNMLRCYVMPREATDKTIVWSSSNVDIASVDENGIVTGKQLGDVVITASSVKDNIKSNFNLRIENLNLRFEFESSLKMLYVGGRCNNNLDIFPRYAYDIERTWSSSDENVATVDNRGEVIANKVGKARITVTHNEKSAYYTVEVVEKTIDKVNIKFTDSAFKNALLGAGVDENRDGEISIDEALMVTKLRFYDKGITDITEIKYFKNIESLSCGNNKLTEVNIEQNTKLTYINFYFNRGLKNINVSKNIELKDIYLYGSPIESLDLSRNTKLRNLNCPGCKLTALDVSFCVNLERIACSGNAGLKEVFVFDKKLADSSSNFRKDDSTNWIEKKN